MRTRELTRTIALILLPAAPLAAACGTKAADPVVHDGDGDGGGDGASGDAAVTEDGPPADAPCEHLPASADGGPIDAAGIPDATNDAGNYPQAYCNTVCPTLGGPGAWKCQSDGDGGVRCVNCT